ncbi:MULTISPECIES: hypothetical protein [unclassified Novosphingobium]|uniref:hypothetical protein n=1 Tax=unclassified Novosphingobium TaxID=2644732 RepID=UPI00190F7E3A|nr:MULTISPECIES: hypothetical protein [unclassified Novosphingobium]
MTASEMAAPAPIEEDTATDAPSASEASSETSMPTPSAAKADPQASIAQLDATCPGGIEVHADEGGPVRLGGKQAKVNISNEQYYEASADGVTVSVSTNADETRDVSYTGPGRDHGISTIR